MLYRLIATLALVASVRAWMPTEKNMTALDGNNIFEAPPSNSSTGEDLDLRWLPGNLPIRGVNLGSLFIIEPWMVGNQWSNVIQCNGASSEFDCVLRLGQSTANQRFQQHWGSFITQNDINEMSSYGLNTIRIPVGYWIFEELKYDSEHFPEGALPYLENVCGWASDKGFYIIIDLHGAPYAQTSYNSFTGQNAGPITNQEPRFFQQSQYDRALSFLDKMTRKIHTSNKMRNVGMIEVVNEPQTSIPSNLLESMRRDYYPAAFRTIRAAEQSLGVGRNDYLHIQMMNTKWGAGDPHQYLTDDYFAAYDDHRYPKFDPSVQKTQQGYISNSCNDDRGGNSPTIVGEWSISVADDVENNSEFAPVSNHIDFYKRWFGAQTHLYEKQDGWVFWSWKAQLNDPRWSYREAVQAGIIPTNLNNVVNPC